MHGDTLPVIRDKYSKGGKIVALTAYDALFAALFDSLGVDILLVGDSLGMLFQGGDTTLSVSVEEMLYHSKVVARAAKRAFVVADMPFMSYQVSS